MAFRRTHGPPEDLLDDWGAAASPVVFPPKRDSDRLCRAPKNGRQRSIAGGGEYRLGWRVDAIDTPSGNGPETPPVENGRRKRAPAAAEPLPPPTLSADAARAHCASCGVAVSEKVRDYCVARPDRFGGRIYYFKHQRRASVAAETS